MLDLPLRHRVIPKGALEKYGEYVLAGRTPVECISGIVSQNKELARDIYAGVFVIRVEGTEIASTDLFMQLSKQRQQTIEIVPVVAGATGNDTWNIVLGATLVAVGLFASLAIGPEALIVTGKGVGIMATALGAVATSVGLTLFTSGLSGLLAKKPDASPEETERYDMVGADNIAKQGVPVPLIYGDIGVGSNCVSAESYGILYGTRQDPLQELQPRDSQLVLVDLLGEGEIEGLVEDGTGGMYFSELPFVDPYTGTTNYKQSEVVLSTGSRIQKINPDGTIGVDNSYSSVTKYNNYGKTATEYNLRSKIESPATDDDGNFLYENGQLVNRYVTITVTDPDVDRVMLNINAPSLMYEGKATTANFKIARMDDLGTYEMVYAMNCRTWSETIVAPDEDSPYPTVPASTPDRIISGVTRFKKSVIKADTSTILRWHYYPAITYTITEYSYQVDWFINGLSTSGITVTIEVDISHLARQNHVRTIRVWREDKSFSDSGNMKGANDLYVMSYTLIKDLKIEYRDRAMAMLSLNAKDFEGSVPSRVYHVKGLKVQVPSCYNPLGKNYNEKYPQGAFWDGTFKYEWTNNPVWVFYDLLTNGRYGLGRTIDPAYIDIYTLFQAAQYCDADVASGFYKDGVEITEPRFTFNGVINSKESAYEVISTVAGVFRAMVYVGAGTIFTAQDAPQPVKRVFGRANVLNGFFSYEGTSDKSRHSAVEVTWVNPDLVWQTDVERYEVPELIQKYGLNIQQVTAMGCTSRGQAHRIARHVIYTEEKETNTVSFAVGLADCDLRPGDVIGIADEEMQDARLFGRLVEVRKDRCIVDYELNVPAGISEMYLTNSKNVVITRNVNGGNGLRTLEIPFTEVLSDDEVASFANGGVWLLLTRTYGYIKYRVLSVAEQEDVYNVVAIQHDETKFVDIDQVPNFTPYVPPVVPSAQGRLEAPTNVAVKPFVDKIEGETVVSTLISWSYPLDSRVVGVRLRVKAPNDNVLREYTETGITLSLPNTGSGNIEIWIQSFSDEAHGNMTSDWVINNFILPSPYSKPGVPRNIVGEAFNGVYNFYWDVPLDADTGRPYLFDLTYEYYGRIEYQNGTTDYFDADEYRSTVARNVTYSRRLDSYPAVVRLYVRAINGVGEASDWADGAVTVEGYNEFNIEDLVNKIPWDFLTSDLQQIVNVSSTLSEFGATIMRQNAWTERVITATATAFAGALEGLSVEIKENIDGLETATASKFSALAALTGGQLKTTDTHKTPADELYEGNSFNRFRLVWYDGGTYSNVIYPTKEVDAGTGTIGNDFKKEYNKTYSREYNPFFKPEFVDIIEDGEVVGKKFDKNCVTAENYPYLPVYPSAGTYSSITEVISNTQQATAKIKETLNTTVNNLKAAYDNALYLDNDGTNASAAWINELRIEAKGGNSLVLQQYKNLFSSKKTGSDNRLYDVYSLGNKQLIYKAPNGEWYDNVDSKPPKKHTGAVIEKDLIPAVNGAEMYTQLNGQIEQRMVTYENASGVNKSSFSVKAKVSKDGKTEIAGFGFDTGGVGTPSNFGINADLFYIMDPSLAAAYANGSKNLVDAAMLLVDAGTRKCWIGTDNTYFRGNVQTSAKTKPSVIDSSIPAKDLIPTYAALSNAFEKGFYLSSDTGAFAFSNTTKALWLNNVTGQLVFAANTFTENGAYVYPKAEVILGADTTRYTEMYPYLLTLQGKTDGNTATKRSGISIDIPTKESNDIIPKEEYTKQYSNYLNKMISFIGGTIGLYTSNSYRISIGTHTEALFPNLPNEYLFTALSTPYIETGKANIPLILGSPNIVVTSTKAWGNVVNYRRMIEQVLKPIRDANRSILKRFQYAPPGSILMLINPVPIMIRVDSLANCNEDGSTTNDTQVYSKLNYSFCVNMWIKTSEPIEGANYYYPTGINEIFAEYMIDSYRLPVSHTWVNNLYGCSTEELMEMFYGMGDLNNKFYEASKRYLDARYYGWVPIFLGQGGCLSNYASEDNLAVNSTNKWETG